MKHRSGDMLASKRDMPFGRDMFSCENVICLPKGKR